ncbi:MAG: toll/interleukin-1 receptor domain-containing protein [Candidatus Bathyarchaeota archaeon]|nr:toll/interleukin-1 receptor domain-containing protein [Candidatus Bathyarchaeota archaeon]
MNNIKSTDCMVVVLTDTGVRSQFVNQEVGAARSINKPVIPTLEKKVKGKIGGLAGLELIIFDKAKPKQAIREVSSYVSRLKLSLELEMKEREDTLKTIAVITFIVFFCSLAVFWLFVKSNECIQASACR